MLVTVWTGSAQGLAVAGRLLGGAAVAAVVLGGCEVGRLDRPELIAALPPCWAAPAVPDTHWVRAEHHRGVSLRLPPGYTASPVERNDGEFWRYEAPGRRVSFEFSRFTHDMTGVAWAQEYRGCQARIGGRPARLARWREHLTHDDVTGWEVGAYWDLPGREDLVLRARLSDPDSAGLGELEAIVRSVQLPAVWQEAASGSAPATSRTL